MFTLEQRFEPQPRTISCAQNVFNILCKEEWELLKKNNLYSEDNDSFGIRELEKFGHLSLFAILSLPFHMVSVSMLLAIQFLNCCSCCCGGIIVQRTILNVDDPFQQIFLDQQEKGKEEEEIEENTCIRHEK